MRRAFVVLVVSHYLHDIIAKKNYNYIFEFVKVMTKVTVGPFFPAHGKRHFNDVTITSSLHSDVQVLMGHFTIFQSHGLS